MDLENEKFGRPGHNLMWPRYRISYDQPPDQFDKHLTPTQKLFIDPSTQDRQWQSVYGSLDNLLHVSLLHDENGIPIQFILYEEKENSVLNANIDMFDVCYGTDRERTFAANLVSDTDPTIKQGLIISPEYLVRLPYSPEMGKIRSIHVGGAYETVFVGEGVGRTIFAIFDAQYFSTGFFSSESDFSKERLIASNLFAGVIATVNSDGEGKIFITNEYDNTLELAPEWTEQLKNINKSVTPLATDNGLIYFAADYKYTPKRVLKLTNEKALFCVDLVLNEVRVIPFNAPGFTVSLTLSPHGALQVNTFEPATQATHSIPLNPLT